MMGFEWKCYNMFMIVYGFLECCWGLNGIGKVFLDFITVFQAYSSWILAANFSMIPMNKYEIS